MDSQAYIDTLLDEPDTFQDFALRLIGALSAFFPSWDAFEINNVVTWAFATFNVSSLTPTPLFCLSSLIQAFRPLYPTHDMSCHDPDMTRLQVLTAYLDGDLDTVAAIRRPLLSEAGPYSDTCPGPAPAPSPTPPPAPRRSAAPSPFPAAAPSPSAHALTAADRHDRHASGPSPAYAMRNISQY